MELQHAAEAWLPRGIRVVGVVGQRPQPVERLRTKRGIAFPVLIDANRAIIKRYGVYHAIGLGAFNIAHPAVFVIDPRGEVQWQHVGRSQFDRPTIEQIERAAAAAFAPGSWPLTGDQSR
ncbi:MAG: redoxin domain-containing protein [bacterium]|nr:redoxin domain-containing protein [bacterium]